MEIFIAVFFCVFDHHYAGSQQYRNHVFWCELRRKSGAAFPRYLFGVSGDGVGRRYGLWLGVGTIPVCPNDKNCRHALFAVARMGDWLANAKGREGDRKPLTFWQAVLFQWVNSEAWVMATGAVAHLPPCGYLWSEVMEITAAFLAVAFHVLVFGLLPVLACVNY